MNLIEAVRSGKKFRRMSSPGNYFNSNPWACSLTGLMAFTREDILSDDWHTEDNKEYKKVEVTRAQLGEALDEVIAWMQMNNPTKNYKEMVFDRLGLGHSE